VCDDHDLRPAVGQVERDGVLAFAPRFVETERVPVEGQCRRQIGNGSEKKGELHDILHNRVM
jgi:hypothetical protein